MADLAESFYSFSEVRKRSLQSRFCSVLCGTISDKDTLLNYGGIILPMLGQMLVYLTFAPSMDNMIRTSFPKEVLLVLWNHKSLFYQ
jgi:hypothetical protein